MSLCHILKYDVIPDKITNQFTLCMINITTTLRIYLLFLWSIFSVYSLITTTLLIYLLFVWSIFSVYSLITTTLRIYLLFVWSVFSVYSLITTTLRIYLHFVWSIFSVYSLITTTFIEQNLLQIFSGIIYVWDIQWSQN